MSASEANRNAQTNRLPPPVFEIDMEQESWLGIAPYISLLVIALVTAYFFYGKYDAEISVPGVVISCYDDRITLATVENELVTQAIESGDAAQVSIGGSSATDTSTTFALLSGNAADHEGGSASLRTWSVNLQAPCESSIGEIVSLEFRIKGVPIRNGRH